MAKTLRVAEETPSDYAEGDYVVINHWWQKPDADIKGLYHRVDEFYNGFVRKVGLSSFDKAYDWYIIELDNGERIESWWMTGYKIVSKASPPASGSPSQEVPSLT